jgi:hypothetical protein
MNKLGFQTGSVLMYASNTIPTTQTISGINDFLLCDGSSYSTTTYSDLYAVIGTTFGGSGSNFNVPDYRTYFPVGVGGSFVLGTAVSASAATGTDTLKVSTTEANGFPDITNLRGLRANLRSLPYLQNRETRLG